MSVTTNKSKKALPTCIVIGGVPFDFTTPTISEHTVKIAHASSLFSQKIEIIEDAPFPRQLSYAMGEVARLLLDAAGYRGSKTVDTFGSVLYRLVRENSFTWIYENAADAKLPSTLFVNGIPYTITISEDKHLDDTNLLGEVDYTTLSIAIHSKLKQEARDVIFLHETAHAMLYEAQCRNICNNEKLIEPLSYLLYQMFKQNDFSFAYNG